jgi:thioredoxin reductase
MTARPEDTALNRRHRVVVIGSGFGGLNAVKKLKRADVDIKLIARTTHHLFQPMLYQVATGIVAEGAIAPPTRMILRGQHNAQVLLGDVTHIDLRGKFVVSELLGHSYETPFDSLIIAAGAGQSYFGNDHFAEFAPGMKSIDDALELRGRIMSAFEAAERSNDPERRQKLLTFTVVGAGPTGVEMAGQIAELADFTLKGAYRHIDSTKARVILLDAAPAVLPPMGENLGKKAAARLEKMGVEIQLGAMVTATASRSRTPTAPPVASSRPARCGPRESPPARWAAILPANRASNSTARAGSRYWPTCQSLATPTCLSLVTWPPSTVCPGLRKVPSRAASTPRARSRPNWPAPTLRSGSRSSTSTRGRWPRFRGTTRW